MSRLLKSLCLAALLASLLWSASPALAAVALDSNPGTDSYAGTATSNSNTNHTVGTGGANYCLLATLVLDYVTASPSSAQAVTWNGTAMTLITGGSVTVVDTTGIHTIYVGLFYLMNPASGNNTLAATWTGSAVDSFLSSISFTGVNQTGGSTSFPHIGTPTSATGSPSSTVTTTSGNAVVAAGGGNYGAAGGNLTNIYSDNETLIRSFGQYTLSSSSSVISSFGGSNSPWAQIVVDVAQAVAVTNHKLSLLGVGN